MLGQITRRAAAGHLLNTPEPPASDWLTRSGTALYLNGNRWRGAGFNWHWAGLRETNLQYPSHAMIDQVLDEAVAMGATVIRAHTLGMSAGLSNQLVTSINANGSLVWNNAAWEPIDYVIAGARARGIRLWIPFTDIHNFYHKGRGWWVQQAFIRQGTSNIPSTYTYNNGTTTENGVTSYTPNNGGFNGSARDKAIQQQFYRNTWVKNAWINNYVVAWFNHVNQYSGVANKDEPMVAFAQAGNEMWDSGDEYPDHAGADGIAWAAQFSAAVKGVSPNIMVIDPQGADGANIDFAPGRNDANTDMLDYHLYNNHNAFTSGYVTALAAKAASHNKVAVYGEYPFTRTGMSTALSEIESTSAVGFACFWATYVPSEGHTPGGVDDSVYMIGQNLDWRADFQAHAAIMNGGTVPEPPAPPVNIMRSANVARVNTTTASYSVGTNTGTPPSLAIDTTNVAEGSNSLRVTIQTAGYPYIFVTNALDGAAVAPGQTYTVSVSLKIGSGGITQAVSHLTWYNSAGNFLSGVDGNVVSVSTSGFTQVIATAIAPAGAASVVPQFQFPNSVPSGAVIYADQWGVFAGSSATPWSAPV